MNGAKSCFTVAAPELWLFVLGALFVVVTLFAPRGLAGARGTACARRPRERAARSRAPRAGEDVTAAVADATIEGRSTPDQGQDPLRRGPRPSRFDGFKALTT